MASSLCTVRSKLKIVPGSRSREIEDGGRGSERWRRGLPDSDSVGNGGKRTKPESGRRGQAKICAREGYWNSFGILKLVADFREDGRIVYISFMKEGEKVPTMEQEASGDKKTICFFHSLMLYIPTTSGITPRNEAAQSSDCTNPATLPQYKISGHMWSFEIYLLHHLLLRLISGSRAVFSQRFESGKDVSNFVKDITSWFSAQKENLEIYPDHSGDPMKTIVANKIRKREWTLATIAFLLDPVDPLFCKALFSAGSLANSPWDNYDRMLAADCSTIDGDHLVDEDTMKFKEKMKFECCCTACEYCVWAALLLINAAGYGFNIGKASEIARATEEVGRAVMEIIFLLAINYYIIGNTYDKKNEDILDDQKESSANWQVTLYVKFHAC
ncbi:hypothetical protein RHSIM_Rhsim07G0184600 [Rhododendron simsii]|uniref:Uncharacterized protein n=1 Tax=Rhododendron simsii TaxID=118357 RepID=A0A834LHW7_RHOSS|nr:hypothetical protein RHSIM_Rhsim07G0184600 [Rhododendron simsii]